MSYYKLKTSVEALTTTALKSYILSDDLKHLVVYNQFSFNLINLQTRNIVLSNECHEHMRIKYCALDRDVFIVQYQMPNNYLLHIRSLRSALYCHEVEMNQEITCYVKADFRIDEDKEVLGLFFGTSSGRVKFFNFKAQNQLFDIDLKDDPRVKKPKLKKIVLFHEDNIRLLVTVDEGDRIDFYTFDGNFDCRPTGNSYQATRDKQLLIDIFRVVKGKNEIFLGLIVKTEDFISLYTAEPQRFTQQTQNLNSLFTTTVLRKFSPYVKYTLLKEPVVPNSNLEVQGDVLAMIDEMAREFIDLKLYFLKTGEEIEHRYTPDEKLREVIGPLFVDAAGLVLHPQNIPNRQKKVSICVVLNKARNVLFDQIRLAEDTQFVRLEKEKYQIFKENFELTPQGAALIEAQNLFIRRPQNELSEETHAYDVKLGFLEFLLKTDRQQVIIDIIMRKEVKEGDEEESYLLLELERCEEALYSLFETEREGHTFNYLDVDQQRLRNYKTFLANVLRVYNAIIKRKEEEALVNVRDFRAQNIIGMEDDILNTFTAHRHKVQKESSYCKVLEYVADTQLTQIYEAHLAQIKNKWIENRNKYQTICGYNQDIDNQFPFFIDLLTESKLTHPASVNEIFEWIRNTDSDLEKKLIVYYIIKRDLESVVGEPNQNSIVLVAEEVTVLHQKFFAKFSMTDKEVNLLSGLVRLDLLIDKAVLVHDDQGNLARFGKTEDLTKIAREACHHLSACTIENENWKGFILSKFYQYQCHDELAIYMRSSQVNWSDPALAKEHMCILLDLGKVLQAYNFVAAQLLFDETDQALNKDYEELFYGFLDQVIRTGKADQLYDISLRSFEKSLMRNYFEQRNIEQAKYYILYLLKFNQVIEAIEFYAKNIAKIRIDDGTLRFLVWRIGDLPEILRDKVKDNHPVLYKTYQQHISDPSARRDQVMNIEEVAGGKQKEELASRDMLKATADKMYVSTSARSKPVFSIEEVRQAVANKQSNEERLGLSFVSSQQVKRDIRIDHPELVESQYIQRDALKKSNMMEEEENKSAINVGQSRMYLEKSTLLSGKFKGSGLSLIKSKPQDVSQGASRETTKTIRSVGSMKKKLSQLF